MNANEELLTQRLAEAQATIEALISDQIDAVIDLKNKTPVLLAKAQAALRSSERREAALNRFYTLSLDMLGIGNLDGYFTRLNPAFSETLGFTVEELSARPFLDFVHPDDRDATILEMGKLKLGKVTLDFENRYQCRDGSWKWLSWRAHPFPEEGLMYVSARDMTARRDVEEKLRQAKTDADAANGAKTMFLANMSHEIRTPMNAILGYSQLMLRDPALGTATKENLKIMNRSGEHLLSLINAVLDMSQIEAGRTECQPTTFNLPGLLDNLAKMFRLRADAKGLRFDTSLHGESLTYVVADEGKLRQVLINLLGNAIKFTQRGQVKLHVTLGMGSAQRPWFSACIEDTGLGMTEEEQGELFQPFTRIKSRLDNYEGTGLGLAISREYARLMGGDLTVTSRPGVGSVFRFEIPIERGDAAVAIRRSTARRIIGIRAGQNIPKILVVDDQFENRDWLMKLLTLLGFQVRAVNSGEAAIRSFCEWNPQLILMDVHMPVMDGLEATRRIKSVPQGKTTAIIALTASAMDDRRQTILESGVDDFIAKPCNEDELLERIRVHLNIAYDYEEISGAESAPSSGLLALSGKSLGQLPQGLNEELRKATFGGNKSLMDKLILKIRGAGHPESADALQKLVDNYEYEALIHLLEEAYDYC